MELFPNLHVQCKCDNSQVVNIIKQLYFEVLNVEYNLQPWIRSLLKYGNFYLKLHINENNIIDRVQPIHPSQIEIVSEQEGDVYIYNEYRYTGNEIIQIRIPYNRDFLPYGTPAFSRIDKGRSISVQMIHIREMIEHALFKIGYIQIVLLNTHVKQFDAILFKNRLTYLNGKHKTITLCGSTKFKEQFLAAQKRLTLEGNVVISVGLFGHSGDEQAWSENTKIKLDEIHLQKIAMADQIFVINKGGYIGESTKRQIQYAVSNNKIIKYLEPIKQEN